MGYTFLLLKWRDGDAYDDVEIVDYQRRSVSLPGA
jgi:hypothetical protein